MSEPSRAPVSTTHPTALVSLIFGVLAWSLLPFIGAIVAIITGHFARSDLRRLPEHERTGDGMALAGLVLGWVQLALIVVAFLVVFMFFGGLAAVALLGR